MNKTEAKEVLKNIYCEMREDMKGNGFANVEAYKNKLNSKIEEFSQILGFNKVKKIYHEVVNEQILKG